MMNLSICLVFEITDCFLQLLHKRNIMKKIIVTLFVVFGFTSSLSAQTILPKDFSQVDTECVPTSSDYKMDDSIKKNKVTSDSSIKVNKNEQPYKQPEVIKFMIIEKRD